MFAPPLPPLTSPIGVFSKIQIPLINKAYPKLIASKLVDVQPMMDRNKSIPAPDDIVTVIFEWLVENFAGKLDWTKVENRIIVKDDPRMSMVSVACNDDACLVYDLCDFKPNVALNYNDPNFFELLKAKVEEFT